ncbi:MAG: PDDEXK nuclease domain-containing protein [Prevotellaceae bacterium]|jgi:predicted nuclease of restriction endonuclease-like (RecB) superfamily|nr:PDDEXK nuclease domain-containing protein [Prevotellaceae bacterium]
MNFASLVKQIASVQSTMQATAAHAINVSLTIRNWLIGYYIVEFEQNGEDRAKYGEGLLQNLEKKLNTKGLNEKRFREYRRLYTVYPQIGEEITNFLSAETINRLSLAESNLSIRRPVVGEFESAIRRTASGESGNVIRRTASGEFKGMPSSLLIKKIPYVHLLIISRIENPVKRAFYELETIKGNWSRRELERQINTLYYERSGLSKNKEALSALVNQQTIQIQPKDVINTPVTLEFLGLNERALVTENDLEQAILDNLQAFLLEMGHGFCFEARQKRILIDDDYFFVDLLFYHRILKCRVVVELKMDKFRHEYASQLNMYLNYFKHEESAPDDNPPVGILLCTEKGDTQVKYATAGLDQNIFIQKYLVELPNEEALKEYITKEYYNNL